MERERIIGQTEAGRPETMASVDARLSRVEWEQIVEKPHTPEDLLACMSKKFGQIYEEFTGVWEGYTLKKHTGAVLKQFLKYFSADDLPSCCSVQLFELILTLHDIGKPRAVAEGKKSLQHPYTVELVTTTLTEMGYTSSEQDIARALVSADPIGPYIKSARSQNSISKTVNEIRSLAVTAGIPLQDFWKLLNVYYTVDAGSYTKDAGGEYALDGLFFFNPRAKRVKYAPAIAQKMRELHDEIFSKPTLPDLSVTHSHLNVFFPEEVIERVHPIPPAESERLPFPSMSDDEFTRRSGVLEDLQWGEKERVNHTNPAEREHFRDFRQVQYQAALNNEPNEYDWSAADCALMERAVIQFAMEGKSFFLTALYMMGKELDLGYVGELEKKFAISLEKVRLAIHLFRLSRDSADCRDVTYHIPVDRNPDAPTIHYITDLYRLIATTATELAQYSLEATHATVAQFRDSIEQTGQLIKSNEAEDFEGDGVYCGLFGSYDWWGDEKYHFQVPLAYSHPALVITRHGYPQMMCSVLSDSVVLRSPELPVRLRGMVQWRMLDLYENSDTIPQWKLDILQTILGIGTEAITVRTDVAGHPAVIVDTDAPPILWAELCRVLHIGHCIPKSELERFGITTAQPLPFDSPIQRTSLYQSRINPYINMKDSRYRIGTAAMATQPDDRRYRPHSRPARRKEIEEQLDSD